MARLHSLGCLERKENVVVLGQPRVGKTHLAMKSLTFPSLLIVDEIGCLPICCTSAMLFFQSMSRRYEHAPTVPTSNMGCEQWGEILGDDVLAAALFDRLVHHCHIVNIRGNSFPMRYHTDLHRTLGTTRPSTAL